MQGGLGKTRRQGRRIESGLGKTQEKGDGGIASDSQLRSPTTLLDEERGCVMSTWNGGAPSVEVQPTSLSGAALTRVSSALGVSSAGVHVSRVFLTVTSPMPNSKKSMVGARLSSMLYERICGYLLTITATLSRSTLRRRLSQDSFGSSVSLRLDPKI